VTTSPPPSPSATTPAAHLAPGHWRLDPDRSQATFQVKHFWGAITVRGRFERIEGEGDVAPDGTLRGRVRIAATSLTTKNRQRDTHLRSADFFDVAAHPEVIVTITSGTPTPDGGFALVGTIEAAGRSLPLACPAAATRSGETSVRLEAQAEVDRTRFGMTWSPLAVASSRAVLGLVAQFDRLDPADG